MSKELAREKAKTQMNKLNISVNHLKNQPQRVHSIFWEGFELISLNQTICKAYFNPGSKVLSDKRFYSLLGSHMLGKGIRTNCKKDMGEESE